MINEGDEFLWYCECEGSQKAVRNEVLERSQNLEITVERGMTNEHVVTNVERKEKGGKSRVSCS